VSGCRPSRSAAYGIEMRSGANVPDVEAPLMAEPPFPPTGGDKPVMDGRYNSKETPLWLASHEGNGRATARSVGRFFGHPYAPPLQLDSNRAVIGFTRRKVRTKHRG